MGRPSKTPIELTALGRWIHNYCVEHGDMSLDAFGEMIGFSHGHVSKVMRGKAKPSTRFLEEIAKATDATQNEMLIIAYGQPRVEAAREGAKRIMALSGTAQEALNGFARLMEPLSPDDQRMVIGWFKALANMSQSNRAKAISEITLYLKDRNQ